MKGALHRLLQGHQQVKGIQFSGKFRPFATPCAAMVLLFFFFVKLDWTRIHHAIVPPQAFLACVPVTSSAIKQYLACSMFFFVHIAVRSLSVQVLVGANQMSPSSSLLPVTILHVLRTSVESSSRRLQCIFAFSVIKASHLGHFHVVLDVWFQTV